MFNLVGLCSAYWKTGLRASKLTSNRIHFHRQKKNIYIKTKNSCIIISFICPKPATVASTNLAARSTPASSHLDNETTLASTLIEKPVAVASTHLEENNTPISSQTTGKFVIHLAYGSFVVEW